LIETDETDFSAESRYGPRSPRPARVFGAMQRPSEWSLLGPEESEDMVQFPARMIVILSILCAFGPVTLAQDAELPAALLPAGQPTVLRLSLEEAQRLALSNNTTLSVGQRNVQEKLIAADAARRDYFPKLLGNFMYFHFSDNLGKVLTFHTGRFGLLPPGTQTFEAAVANQDSTLTAITLAQPITKLIAVNAAVQLARADAQIAQAQLDKGTRELLSGVSQAFQGMYGAHRIEAALDLQVQVAQQYSATNTNPEIRVAMIEAQQALAQVRSQLVELNEQLRNLLAVPPGTRFELVEPLPPAVPVSDAEEAVQLALRCSPQVQEAMANTDKARAALQVANSEYLPDVNIFGSYFNQTSASYIQPNFGAFGVSASYTFFDWGKRRRVRDQREMQIALASANVRATIEKVRLETVQAYAAYQQAHQAFGLAGDMVAARKDAERRQKAPTELATAKGATAKAELELIQSEIAYRVAHARLIDAIGNP
jgi:outer membrane protein TolC